MNPKYEQEIREFRRNFAGWRDKNLVLYGIGRYTATLLEGLEGFRIIGLMDKDPANVGREYFGLPVMDAKTVGERADAVIINTAGTYWSLIYQRIKDLGIPVFCRNGERAREEPGRARETPYWDSSLEALQQKISEAEAVSFDFYDTLFSRRVCHPRDALWLWERQMALGFPGNAVPWMELREKSLQRLPANYSLDSLYREMERMGNLPTELSERAKQQEMELERRMLVPRGAVCECMARALREGKEVYVITDMYLPERFFAEALASEGLHLEQGHILVSGSLGKSKADGSLWRHYRERIGQRRALHVGDHPSADIEKARVTGIDAYYIANAWQMLTMSSLRELASKICSRDASLLMGCILGRLFRDPFCLGATRGIPRIETGFDMGYCIFGPVLLAFFRWLLRQARKDNVRRLVFMSRDGYFLRTEFEEYLACCGEELDTCYLGISRQLAMTAAIETEADIRQLLEMPYTGTMAERLEDRFGIRDARAETVEEAWEYLPQMKSYAEGVRRRYQKYLEGFCFSHRDAIVDLGYYGNNQRYLNRISGTDMRGYYVNANVSSGNRNAAVQSMKPCFQKTRDAEGKESGVLKHQIYLESFLTAPYGMVADIAEDGSFLCKERKQNQRRFPAKVKIHEGVKAYIHDFMDLLMEKETEEDREFAGAWYSVCFEGGVAFGDAVKASFYNDNAMMHRMESNLFC